MLCKAIDGFSLPNIMRDFKKYTSKNILQTIINYPESRREWLLAHFKNACVHLKRNQNYKVWQDGYHTEVCSSNTFIKQKLDYIFSSARNYADLDSELEVAVLVIF